MPRPVFIICAEASAQDKDSGLLSVFELLETLQIAPLPVPKEGQKVLFVRSQPFELLAAWMIQPDKGDRYEDEYEYEFTLYLPPDEQPVPLIKGTFSFESPKPFQRFALRFDSAPPMLKSPGVMRVEGRIRKMGHDSWVSQDYPVTVQIIQTAKPDADGEPSPQS